MDFVAYKLYFFRCNGSWFYYLIKNGSSYRIKFTTKIFLNTFHMNFSKPLEVSVYDTTRMFLKQ